MGNSCIYVLAKRERKLSSAKKPWKSHPLCTRGFGLRISPEDQSFVGRIIEGTLEEGRGNIFGSREILSEGSEGSGVANSS